MSPYEKTDTLITASLMIVFIGIIIGIIFYYLGRAQGAHETLQQVYDAKEMDKARERNGR